MLGRISEGVASWTLDYNFAKEEFKEKVRPGNIMVVFGRVPAPGEVVLNIAALWAQDGFKAAVYDYTSRGGPYAQALSTIANKQNEIILDAPSNLNKSKAFGITAVTSTHSALSLDPCSYPGTSIGEQHRRIHWMVCPALQLGHDSWPLSDEGNFTTEKSFRLPWLRDDDAPAT
jgi:hypothetical protein